MKTATSTFQRILASLTAFALATAALRAASVPSVGIIAAAHAAHVGEAEASEGTTLYDGDRLATAGHGWLRVSSAEFQLQLSGETVAFLRESPPPDQDGSAIELASGSIDISAHSAHFLLLARGAVFRPAGNRAVLAHVAIRGHREIQVTMQRGDMEFVYRSEKAVLHESKTYAVVLDPSDKEIALAANFVTERSDPQPDPQHGARKPLFLLIVIVAVAAAVGIPLLLHSLESPDRP